ncbi:serine hydrolase [Robertkochia marina]|uniref:Serine hydrolase n=1 Tax=Robertkochia marina TaxID=1227945 RepID=A0A4S3M1T4_9FLAO|nr:serine hydrolase [Robertkochia marina]THD69062.1 serine hydrolase [Robertkochia marina]TRZ44886.1 serine hydrolase [Robertkochia marina]
MNLIKRLLLLLLILPVLCFSQEKVTSAYIDSLAEVSMAKFPQAGVAIGVIQNGEVTHLKGYGVASKNKNTPVDENTLFAIASNSKAFTATALGILVDRGELSWTDKVTDHIPEFRMYAPYVTANFTLVDLLTHRSGLGLGAGDLMFFPDGADFTVDDVIKSFQYQTPVSDFRTKYDYDNLLYVVAGEVVHRVSGKPWDQFVQDEIMANLGMAHSVGIFQNISGYTNIAYPHKTENGEVIEIPTYTKNDGSLGAAGGIYSSVSDLSNWVKMHLNRGAYGESKMDTLISEVNQMELWKIHTNIFYDPFGDNPFKQHYRGYGLGFFLQDMNGYTVVNHTGGLPGMLSMVTMLPELNAGIIVLTNCDPGGYNYRTLSFEIIEKLTGVDTMDWIAFTEEQLNRSSSEAEAVVNAVWEQVEKSGSVELDPSKFTGTYKDPWFGKVEIYEKDGILWFRSLRSPKLHGKMSYYQANTFAIAWDYHDMNCDAFATFQLDETGKASAISMKGISPEIDFSFDFHDLDLRRITE